MHDSVLFHGDRQFCLSVCGIRMKFLRFAAFLLLFSVSLHSQKQVSKESNGFVFSKLHFIDHFTYVLIKGEVLNQSGRYYTDAYFTVKLYDDSNDLLGVSLVLISHFGPGKKKTFDATTDTVDIKMIKKYEIVFENEN